MKFMLYNNYWMPWISWKLDNSTIYGLILDFSRKNKNPKTVKFRELTYMNRSYMSENVKFREFHIPWFQVPIGDFFDPWDASWL